MQDQNTSVTSFSLFQRQKHVLAGVVCITLVLGGCLSSSTSSRVVFAPGPTLSEDERVASDLNRSLSAFLDTLCRGELSDTHTSIEERERYEFFYNSLLRGARDTEPVVLKSYPIDGGAYLISVAFIAGEPGSLTVSRIVELQAVPVKERFHFRCPYEYHTAQLQRRTIGDVTFRFNGAFDEERAVAFAQFRTRFDEQLGRSSPPLQYDCFESLDELLSAFGLVHDRSKCNFLRHDLGFLWDDAHRFTTGTGNESYIFGYVSGVLPAGITNAEDVYWPYVNGVAAYYGGYGLSGDSMDVLARQFREELEQRPTINFLEEFKKGRKSSIQRHFSHYVMCAFLYQEIAVQHGEAAALQLVRAGADDESFFSEIDRMIGVTEENFHATILRLIDA